MFSSLVAFVILSATPGPTWRSEAGQGHLLELYTSEGCSSCPPAERVFLGLRGAPELWKSVFPVQFHVDYWDYLGWADGLARPEFSERQRRYAREWGDASVYTPCFVADGVPTRALPDGELGADVGVLNVTQVGEGVFDVSFAPVHRAFGQARVMGVVIAENVRQKVRAGENRGRTLDHAYVALGGGEASLRAKGGGWVGRIKMQRPQTQGPVYVAFWVTQGVGLAPVQVVGGLWP